MAIPNLDAFQVIADPSRRQILQMLTKDSYNINSISENFEMSRPAVSKHIKILQTAGFVSIQIIGREHYCILNRDGFNEIKEWINHFDKFWNNRLKKLETILKNETKS
ncbi:metalloregulator ArsR/SmtB family transcription factor [Galbibacter sp. EGI 63066]|uniref:ArsR/SmtB family transcription factor n=1 Tax=Galbibacter sp. EGI 63066 TaxID=2993559 RepID=UPI00224985CD|nr:metalloregulator ArsR/SmtB family transcription factor [Galbibacter sp. EGI 63066]MCX2680257.1 metalloregulator ArsR/SmtB family transcription factor [Galbibacter sp. EGI 63066]